MLRIVNRVGSRGSLSPLAQVLARGLTFWDGTIFAARGFGGLNVMSTAVDGFGVLVEGAGAGSYPFPHALCLCCLGYGLGAHIHIHKLSMHKLMHKLSSGL